MGISEKLQAELERQNLSVREFQQRIAGIAPEGAKGTSYASVYEYVGGRVEEPSMAFLKAAAEVLGVRSAWLAFDEGPRTEREAQQEARTRAALLEGGLLGELVEEIVSSESAGELRDTARKAALLRFARRAHELGSEDVPWSSEEGFHSLMEAAFAFLGCVDSVFDERAKQFPEIMPWDRLPPNRDHPEWSEEKEERHRRRLERDEKRVLVLYQDSAAFWGTWYDEALSLLSRRVIGLGSQVPQHPHP